MTAAYEQTPCICESLLWLAESHLSSVWNLGKKIVNSDLQSENYGPQNCTVIVSIPAGLCVKSFISYSLLSVYNF